MFTGLVEEVGSVVSVEDLGDAVRLRFRAPLVTEDARHGESIAVNGCCLTAIDIADAEFSADVMAETLDKTTLGALTSGARVNLERAMALGDRLGGHIVQGHVDGTGRVMAREPSEHWEIVRISIPAHLSRYLVAQGSITVDGTSLTVVDAPGGGAGQRAAKGLAGGAGARSTVGAAKASGDSFTVSLIPTTLADTVLGDRPVGSSVNLEVDILAKHVEQLLKGRI